MGTNKAEEIKSVLTNDFGYDFESEFFTDEIKTLVDEVIEVTNNSSQSEIDELTKEVERLKVLLKRLLMELNLFLTMMKY